MHLAYVDESGSVGPNSSQTFTLGCVLVDAKRWPDVFDEVIEFRRYLHNAFKIPVRAELKANYLLRNGGQLRELKLSEAARFRIYRGFMRLQKKLDLKVFAVVIRKNELAVRRADLSPRDVAWEYLLQRLERFTTKGDTQIVLNFDEGEGLAIRAMVRKARRIGSAGSASGTGLLRRPARLILDDPIPRKSHESYFIQLADMVAYAAFRSVYAPPERNVQIVPQSLWLELGDAILTEVNMVSGGTPGIVVWPK
jgi:hypothetical protein